MNPPWKSINNKEPWCKFTVQPRLRLKAASTIQKLAERFYMYESRVICEGPSAFFGDDKETVILYNRNKQK
jgi:hypothetical protein